MRKFPSSITSLSFTPDGSMLCIASTHMYESDDTTEVGEPSILIRKISELEVRPK